ncbi:hypothetical protein [Undibacterium sp.]|uniref:hypothetical protein n=1 Tax=Undibacterium sp. TaxID=1914977 RepID=UPI002730FBE5|nr:hypothetical protein [Undibacterium sp.]MDP1976697.1 hypothetical protein [Undibacterium sp.]
MISLLNLVSDKVKYDPNHLFDILIKRLRLKNDAALAKMLDVAPPVISKIRHLRLPIGASLMITMHEISGLTIKELRALMGDKRETFRITDSQLKPSLAKSRPKTKERTVSQQY